MVCANGKQNCLMVSSIQIAHLLWFAKRDLDKFNPIIHVIPWWWGRVTDGKHIFGYFSWKFWTTFKGVLFTLKIFQLSQLSRTCFTIHDSDWNFQSFSLNGKQPRFLFSYHAEWSFLPHSVPLSYFFFVLSSQTLPTLLLAPLELILNKVSSLIIDGNFACKVSMFLFILPQKV